MSNIINQAVVIHGANDVRVERRPEPLPGPGQVQVNVELGGICGSDLSYYRNGAVGDFVVQRPMVLGHEIVGTVREIGTDVAGRHQSTRVAVDPSTPCLGCDRCIEGRTNACLEPTFLGSASTDPHVDGGFSTLMLTGVDNLVPIPAGLASADVVFAEPLAVTLHAINRADGVAGKRVLVIGAGPIGAITAAAAVHLGGAEVVVSDIDTDRLAIAGTLGVHGTIDANQFEPAADFDVVFEASGSGPGIVAAIEATRKAGTLVMVGLPHGGPIQAPIGLTVSREIDLLGSFRFCNDEFVSAVELLGDGLDLSPLRTNTFHAADSAAAFATAVGPRAMKVQLRFSAP